MLGIRTRGRRMVGTDKTTELCRPALEFHELTACISSTSVKLFCFDLKKP